MQQAHCCNRRKNKNLNIYIGQKILKTFLDDDQITVLKSETCNFTRMVPLSYY